MKRVSPTKIPSLTGYSGNSWNAIMKHLGIKVPKVKKVTIKERAIVAGYSDDPSKLYRSTPTDAQELKDHHKLISSELSKCEKKDPKLESQIKGIVNMRYGTTNEAHIISLFPHEIDRSSRFCKHEFDEVVIAGYVDGICMIDGEKYVVEIKTRATSKLNMSMVERIQLLCYCNILEIDHIIFLQMQDDILHPTIIKNFRQKYEELWRSIIFRLNLISIYSETRNEEILYWTTC